MAVIKTFDTLRGHLWTIRFLFPVTDVESLLEEIKRIEDPTDEDYIEEIPHTDVYYIGEENLVDVDLSRIKCEDCRKNLERLG